MNNKFESLSVKAVDWQDGALVLLDQRNLPLSEDYMSCHDVEQVYTAIKTMVVRGAPAIGICAAYGVVLSAKKHLMNGVDFYERINKDIEFLSQARPTAVNLAWALKVMQEELLAQKEQDFSLEKLLLRAQEIHQEDIANNFKMGDLACSVFKRFHEKPFSVMTHCNAGGLATGGYGTALGVIRSAWSDGLITEVFADETRPWMQGTRLTVWELMRDDIPVTLNADSAASWVIQNKSVEWIIVGADRIAANGDVVNKIGTYSLAIQARYHGAKVMVVAPSSTVDMASKNGASIEIEMRDSDELKCFSGQQVSEANVQALNPVFDVTPASLVDYIVTERGVIAGPTLDKMTDKFSL
ncbi:MULTISPECIES: S-methyl-5-thioribose-1-phosphate isomerase [unclassified Oleiphilus]|uniref:S-methyl-5-thioribose-1-phosphate isomerase n=2 Tax=Oleiphilus TaxID=141450 RepID=UPI0007C28073|nr:MULTISPECIES: S-methyl-5-thioribose-1-phosphate isomerase [unclassified Oleiphilus]KZY45677.1 S-methyl-5-thioribose-1-phosphate isomerase [Oleiphilus sp. HI0050]KZY79056.1 S-methyl-5-thioribose-1-phosphate isomerase [Oleiphilus sp. HI0069]KZY79106.1 S-methyl-5-thioribose-1-phosphate isomerase [Oleiphilus sp. HI0068]KZY93967.1 S-methyl-5-thioribose-1-phosphate isomerase [Oleiphilus sp. HI0072]KZY37787.1 S-methyl-5-thioribose-1-phosphate isomerase [Oleiphilus sp. HI0043]